jgi:hypothetical protein
MFMLQDRLNVSGPGGTQKLPTAVPKSLTGTNRLVPAPLDRKPAFTKIFRWHLPAGQKQEPAVVEIVGTFTHWQKMPLVHDRVRGGWQLTLDQLAGHRTHHYMILADGKPVHDPNCDGLAIPRGRIEEQFALPTARGPRVFMLFAQAK